MSLLEIEHKRDPVQITWTNALQYARLHLYFHLKNKSQNEIKDNDKKNT